MPYIILLVLVIAIVVIASRKQKFEQGNSTHKKSQREIDKENSIEVEDYVEVQSNNSDTNSD